MESESYISIAAFVLALISAVASPFVAVTVFRATASLRLAGLEHRADVIEKGREADRSRVDIELREVRDELARLRVEIVSRFPLPTKAHA